MMEGNKNNNTTNNGMMLKIENGLTTLYQQVKRTYTNHRYNFIFSWFVLRMQIQIT